MDVVAIFLAWLERSALPVGIVVVNTKPNHVKFGIEGWNCLHGSLSDNGIEIYAVRSGECWDIIWDSDISPKEFDNGWGLRPVHRRLGKRTVPEARVLWVARGPLGRAHPSSVPRLAGEARDVDRHRLHRLRRSD